MDSGGGTSVAATFATTTVTTAPSSAVCSSLPSGQGVLAGDCVGKSSGQSCVVLCDTGFEGGPTQYTCNAGAFEGPSAPCQVVSCSIGGLPPDLDSSLCEGIPLGGFCFVRCPQGFVFAESVYSCQMSGNFSGSPPICSPLVCSSDGLPQDYRLNISSCVGAIAGQSCQVACNFGFESATVSSSNFQCENDGNFRALDVGPLPSCSPKKCPAPSPGSSSVPWATDCEGKQHGQTCMAICSAGHSGSPTQFICENGQILGQQPSCIPLPCQLTGQIAVGVDFSACSGITTGSSCERRCIFGYEGVGDPAMVCQSDGSFSYSQFQCQATVCGKLSDILPFASPEFKDSCQGLSFGQSCSVLCETGWDIDGDAITMLCNNTPAQSAGYGTGGLPAVNSTPPTCVAKPCAARLPNIRGATHNCENKTTLQTCTVDAALGFTSDGVATLQCGTDGEFKGSFPSIEAAVCPTPTFGIGVASTCANKTIGAECWAYCVSGYTGSSQAYSCVADSNAGGAALAPVGSAISCSARRLVDFNPSDATARRLVGAGCGEPAVAAFGLTNAYEHSCATVADTEICICHCNFGWALSGDASLLTCQDGVLTGSLPSCSPVACTYNLPSALGVTHNCSGVTTGGSCSATCGAPGFANSGSGPEVFECLATGEFQGQDPSCAPAPCENLTLASQFEHNCRGMVFQDACAVSCAEGYSLTGPPSQYICGANAIVEGALPTCTANPCSHTMSGEVFQSDSCNGVTTGSSCTVSCQQGMIPNSGEMTCHSSGLLVGTLPLCLPAQCPQTPALGAPAVAHNCENASFGQSCSVYCATGYKLTQGKGELWHCDLVNGSLALTGSLPTCEALTCSIDLNPSDSWTDNCSAELEVGESCIQSCRKGYMQNGSAESILCNSDLTVGGRRPQCQSVVCDTEQLNGQFQFLQHSCDGVTADRSCFAFCRVGFVAEQGAVEWICADGGSAALTEPVNGFALRGVIPSCVAQVCKYNIPAGDPSISHNCTNVSTDETCIVSCADGWLPRSPETGFETMYTCGSDRVLNGKPLSCTKGTTSVASVALSTTRTTTTTWTVFLRGAVKLQPLQKWPLTFKHNYLLQYFVSDPDVKPALATAIASALNVSVHSIELNVTILAADIRNAGRRLSENDTKDMILVEYACSRSFPSLALATDWASREISLEEVEASINENLASGLFQAQVLGFELEISGLPVVSEPSEPSALWVLPFAALLFLCFSFVVGSLCYAHLCRGKEAAAATAIDEEQGKTTLTEENGNANAGAIVVLEAAQVGEVRAGEVAAVVTEDLEVMLQEVGVGFDGSSESDEELNEVVEAAMDGLGFVD